MSLHAARRRVALALAAVVFWFAPLTLSPLGALGDAPRPVWVAGTALMPAFGIWWLVTTYANKGDERATTVAGA